MIARKVSASIPTGFFDTAHNIGGMGSERAAFIRQVDEHLPLVTAVPGPLRTSGDATFEAFASSPPKPSTQN